MLDALRPGRDWAVGGDIAESADFADHQRDKLPWVIGFVLLPDAADDGRHVPQRADRAGHDSAQPASVAAAFGVLTLVFQHSWAEGLLDFHSSGFVIDWIPLFMFVVLVGLSMDYHVFVLSRIREGVSRGLPPKLAVEAGVTETAGVVTSAAPVMVSVFAIFATLSMLEMKQMGVGLAVAILLDATLVRVVMLPSMLVLLGERGVVADAGSADRCRSRSWSRSSACRSRCARRPPPGACRRGSSAACSPGGPAGSRRPRRRSVHGRRRGRAPSC